MAPATLDPAVLRELSDLVAARLGLNFPEARWPDLARALGDAASELGFDDPGRCARWLRTQAPGAPELTVLACHLTVGETYFFRNPASFDALARNILPPLLASRRGADRAVRLWSAGCCTGEEAYSLAITCHRAVADSAAGQFSILGTDVNARYLAKAEAGLYTNWSFRGAPAWVRERYFSPGPGKVLAIDPSIKALVRFAPLNLAEYVYPSRHNETDAMDVIFCRNVLMYFTPEHRQRVVTALYQCLVDGGYLIVDPTEASAPLFSMFAPVDTNGLTLYRKTAVPPCQPALPQPFAPASTPLPPFVPVQVTAAVKPAVDRPVAIAARPAPVPAPAPADPLAQARSLANTGQLEQALSVCHEAIATDRTNPAAHFLSALIALELGRTGDAVGALRKALYLDPDFILAHHVLGGLYQRLGNSAQARTHLRVACELLAAHDQDEIVPASDGLTCGRLLESVRATMGA